MGQRILFLLGILTAPSRADIVLDDFDDAAVGVPVGEDSFGVITENVGPLRARRTLSAFSPFTPLIYPEVMEVRDSQLFVDVLETTVYGIAMSYEFDEPVDFGNNNMAFVDVSFIQSEKSLLSFSGVFDRGRILSKFEPIAGTIPITLTLADDVPSVDELRLIFNVEFDDFQVQVDRIRIGRIPEPTSLVLALLAGSLVLARGAIRR